MGRRKFLPSRQLLTASSPRCPHEEYRALALKVGASDGQTCIDVRQFNRRWCITHIKAGCWPGLCCADHDSVVPDLMMKAERCYKTIYPYERAVVDVQQIGWPPRHAVVI